MPKDDKNILKYNHEKKSMKVPFIIYANMESLLETIDTYHSNAENSSATKINNHAASVYSLFTNCSFDNKKNNHDYHTGKDCMKKLFEDLRSK